MTTTIKAHGPADFLRLVPRMLGYQPTESIVIVAFADTRSKGVMRFDVPADAFDCENVAATIVGMAVRIEGITAIAPIVYSNQLTGLSVGMLDAIDTRAHQCGLHLTDRLIVDDQSWLSLAGNVGGPASELVLEDGAPGSDLPVRANQLAGTELREFSEDFKQATQLAIESLSRTIAALTGEDVEDVAEDQVDVYSLAMVAELDDLPQLYESALDWDAETISPVNVAALTWCFDRPALRDIALVSWVSDRNGGDNALEAQLNWEAGAEYPADLAMAMWGDGPTPDATRLEKGLSLILLALGATPEAHRAGLFATAAWLSWALGRSTHADHFSRQAIAIEAGHGLGEIVQSFVQAGHLPNWAFTTPVR